MTFSPFVDPLDVRLPAELREREAHVPLHVPMEIVIAADPVDYRDWFLAEPPAQPVHEGNEVTYLVDGWETFKAMAEAVRTTHAGDSTNYFVYVIGWFLTESFELVPGDPTSTWQALVAAAAGNGAQVRGLLWKNAVEGTTMAIVREMYMPEPLDDGVQNASACIFMNGLKDGWASLDRRHLNSGAGGSHHQKILIVNGARGLIAFCGGVDINPDRIHPAGVAPNHRGGTVGAPLHDVHCRIRGPGAHDLLRTFTERWEDHESHNLNLEANHGRADLRSKSIGKSAECGAQRVQIGRTYGNGSKFFGIDSRGTGLGLAAAFPQRSGYAFAPTGETTAWRMVLRAIAQAEHFIYVEDQYLVSESARDAIAAVMPRLKHVTVLIPPDKDTFLGGQTVYRRNAFIEPLLEFLDERGMPKLRVFTLGSPDGTHTYVHSKTWIVDDRFAIIGSANSNNRSYTHDSEVVAGIADRLPAFAGLNFAHRLRIALWAEHLGMQTPEGYAELIDGVASGVLWIWPPQSARVQRYIPSPGSTLGTVPWILTDPEGT